MAVLDPAQVDEFLQRGFTVLKGAFDRDFAAAVVEQAFVRQGLEQSEPSSWAGIDEFRYSAEYTEEATWEQGRTHLPCWNRWPMRSHASRAFEAVEELLGAGRAAEPYFSDGFVVNFCSHLPWEPPGPDIGGWHKVCPGAPAQPPPTASQLKSVDDAFGRTGTGTGSSSTAPTRPCS